MSEQSTPLPIELVRRIDAYWRAANYLSVGQIYLYDNPLLKKPLRRDVLNDLDRFHLVSDVIDRVPGLGARAAYAQQAIREKLIEHKQYITRYGEDLPEIRNWTWNPDASAKRPSGRTASSRKKRP